MLRFDTTKKPDSIDQRSDNSQGIVVEDNPINFVESSMPNQEQLKEIELSAIKAEALFMEEKYKECVDTLFPRDPSKPFFGTGNPFITHPDQMPIPLYMELFLGGNTESPYRKSSVSSTEEMDTSSDEENITSLKLREIAPLEEVINQSSNEKKWQEYIQWKNWSDQERMYKALEESNCPNPPYDRAIEKEFHDLVDQYVSLVKSNPWSKQLQSTIDSAYQALQDFVKINPDYKHRVPYKSLYPCLEDENLENAFRTLKAEYYRIEKEHIANGWNNSEGLKIALNNLEEFAKLHGVPDGRLPVSY